MTLEERIVKSTSRRNYNKIKNKCELILALLENSDRTLDDICFIAHMSRSTFFNYFDSCDNACEYTLIYLIGNSILNHSSLEQLVEILKLHTKCQPITTWAKICETKSSLNFQFEKFEIAYLYKKNLSQQEVNQFNTALQNYLLPESLACILSIY